MTRVAVWYRVSTGRQETDNQVPDVERFCEHHGYAVAETYALTDSAYKDGGGPEYKRTMAAMLADAHAGRFSVLVVWALDRIIRDDESGAEAALRLVRQLRERGCLLVSVHEDWLNGSPEVQDLLLAFAGWRAQQESKRRSGPACPSRRGCPLWRAYRLCRACPFWRACTVRRACLPCRARLPAVTALTGIT